MFVKFLLLYLHFRGGGAQSKGRMSGTDRYWSP